MITIPDRELFMRVRGDYYIENEWKDPDVMICIGVHHVAPKRILNMYEPNGTFKKVHRKIGWTIKGKIDSDYYTWCSSFTATHTKWGRVVLSASGIVATSRIGFEAFWFHFGKDMSTFNILDI
jgi:hypothetical protein